MFTCCLIVKNGLAKPIYSIAHAASYSQRSSCDDQSNKSIQPPLLIMTNCMTYDYQSNKSIQLALLIITNWQRLYDISVMAAVYDDYSTYKIIVLIS